MPRAIVGSGGGGTATRGVACIGRAIEGIIARAGTAAWRRAGASVRSNMVTERQTARLEKTKLARDRNPPCCSPTLRRWSMAPGLAAWGITTSEQLIQLLKQNKKGENTLPGSKIQILQSAWADDHVYVPKKAELLLDCALELVLASTRTPHSESTPKFLDSAYWAFLGTLLASAHLDEEHLHSAVAKHNVFALVAALGPRISSDLWHDVCPVLTVVLPVAIRRIGAGQVDTVNACFRDLLQAMPTVSEPRHWPATRRLWDAICMRWSPLLELGANAKKTARFFVAESLLPWAHAFAALADHDSDEASALRDALGVVAARSLSGAPALGAQAGPTLPESVESLVPAVTEALTGPDAPAMLPAIPALLEYLVESAHRRNSVQAPPLPIRQQALDRFLAPICTSLLARPDSLTVLWHLVQQIERLRLYQPGGDDHDAWLALWTRLQSHTLSVLDTASEAETRRVCFDMSTSLWHREAGLVRPALPYILARAVPLRDDDVAWPAALAFVHTLLHDMAQERRMPELLSILRATMARVCDTGPEDVGARLVHSPVLCTPTTLLWRKQLTQHVSAAQSEPMWHDALADAQRHMSPPTPQLACALHVLLLLAQTRPIVAEVAHLVATCLDLGVEAYVRGQAPTQQRLLAGALRLHTALTVQGASVPPLPLDALCRLLGTDSTLPEVRVEVVRALCCHAERTQTLPPMPKLPDLVRAGLEGHTVEPWDGQVWGLTAHAQEPVALWRLLTTRWAPVVDAHAPETLLNDLAVIFTATLAPSAPSLLAKLSVQALHDAHFLELPRWRHALMAPLAAALDVSSTAPSAVRLLACVPTEYVGRDAVHAIAPGLWRLTRRATPDLIGTDAALLRLLRRWLHAYAPAAAPPFSLAAYLDTLVQWPSLPHSVSERAAFLTSSMQLVDALLSHAPAAVCVPDVLAVLQRAPAGWGATVALHARSQLLRWAAATHPPWATELVPETTALGEAVEQAVAPLTHSARVATDAGNLACTLDVVAAQLELRAPSAPSLEPVLPCVLTRLESLTFAVRAGEIPAAPTRPLATSLLQVLVALGPHVAPASRYVGLGVALAQLLRTFPTNDHFSAIWVAQVARMNPDDYERTLHALSSALEPGTACKPPECAALLQVLSLLLQHGAPGTGRPARMHFSALLVRLAVLLPDMPTITLAAVQLLEHVCQNRARMLRAPDVPRLLALLGQVVGARSSPPSAADASAIYQSVCATLRALVRQRKDLVRPCLPHLTDLIARLCLLLSSFVRAHTGEALVREIAAALPAWLDVAAAPLTSSEARALARLLSELGAKTSTAAPAAKRARLSHATTESLRKPLSKYAVYMLLAYVRSATMPYTTIAAALRTELQPGLFVLCDVCGEHERDAALKHALDASGQVVFQALWADWERQRYKGT
ncbi:unnamed protein product [Malassezia sympodialis ATCC 42132]|nr:uncharacterized protein MSY001_0467 [Malassezia sympodialis ATCC 42132]CCU97761.1 unnamed protein product [Malassezia sympodialis ATCC 42132]|eukprot:XP_018739096.1 uncharacterized protein MSY001_0467 [Malassezia sympodialis ATCC 42132]